MHGVFRFTAITKASVATAQRAISNGEEVAAGDVLLEVETDKAQIDVEAAEDGIVAKILVGEGERVPVNTTIALLAEEGDDLSNIEIPADEPKEAAPAEEKKAEEAPAAPAVSTPSEPIDHHDIDTSKLKKPLSPAVLSLLLKHGIKDISNIKPTGPGGRLLKGDVLGHLGLIDYKAPPPFANTAAPPRDQIVFAKPLKPVAKPDAKAEAAEKPAIPMFISKSVTVDNLFNLRNTINATHSTDLTLDEFFAKAAARALRDVAKPSANGPRTSTGVVYDQSSSPSFSNVFSGAKYNIFNLAPASYDFISNSYESSKPYTLTIGSSKQVGGSAASSESYEDLLDFLGGAKSVAKPKAVKMAAGDDLYLSPAKKSSAYHTVELKLEGGDKKGQVLNDAKATVFLDRMEYYVQHPEELVA
ncbi:pyridoxine biosynthesis protein [Umbelopsis nana]